MNSFSKSFVFCLPLVYFLVVDWACDRDIDAPACSSLQSVMLSPKSLGSTSTSNPSPPSDTLPILFIFAKSLPPLLQLESSADIFIDNLLVLLDLLESILTFPFPFPLLMTFSSFSSVFTNRELLLYIPSMKSSKSSSDC